MRKPTQSATRATVAPLHFSTSICLSCFRVSAAIGTDRATARSVPIGAAKKG